VVIVPWAAVFSSFGVASADYFHRYDKAISFFLTPKMSEADKLHQGELLSQAWQELEQSGYQDLEAEGFSREEVNFRHGISARYIGQMSAWEVPVDIGRIETLEHLDKVIGSFEQMYTTIYPTAARFPESGYQITEIYVEAIAKKPKPIIPSYPLQGKEPPKMAHKGQREVYMDGRWEDFDLWEQDLLEAGNRIDGPAIIEHAMTTLVIPSENYVEVDKYKFMWYGKKQKS